MNMVPFPLPTKRNKIYLKKSYKQQKKYTTTIQTTAKKMPDKNNKTSKKNQKKNQKKQPAVTFAHTSRILLTYLAKKKYFKQRIKCKKKTRQPAQT